MMDPVTANAQGTTEGGAGGWGQSRAGLGSEPQSFLQNTTDAFSCKTIPVCFCLSFSAVFILCPSFICSCVGCSREKQGKNRYKREKKVKHPLPKLLGLLP